MVYILSPDGSKKKYACITCIKGHRSSKCVHHDRELLEIKRKGRPITQCDKCRLLRKTRQLHIKCQCPKSDSSNNTSNINTENDKGTLNASNNNNVFAEHSSPQGKMNDSGTSCPQCNRPRLYCNCFTEEDTVYLKQEEVISSASSSSNCSERSLTPPPVNTNPSPVSTFSSPLASLTTRISDNNTHNSGYNDVRITTLSTTATALSSIDTFSRLVSPPSFTPTTTPTSAQSNGSSNSASANRLRVRHLIIPIHDPSDDIDSDTPVYKSMEESHENLGEFANKSSEELIHQIYSNFNSSNSSTSSPLLTEEDDKLVELARDP